MKRSKTFEMVGEEDLFVPLENSDNIAHMNAITQNPAQFDGVTIERMHDNPAYKQGFDAIDMATICRDRLVKDSARISDAASNWTKTIQSALDGSRLKRPFQNL